jgi:TIR domain
MKRTKLCKVFLSYNSADRIFVARLASGLERLGLEVWYDQWKVFPGDSLTTSIAAGIEQANIFVFVLSPASVSAPWPQEELRAALASRILNPSFRVVPVLRTPCRVPIFLRDYLRIHALPGSRYRDVVDEFSRLVSSLGFSVSRVPTVIREVKPFLNQFSASDIDVKMIFHRPRGRVTDVTERFGVLTKQRYVVIRRQIACSGCLSRLSVKPGSLVKKKVLPSTTAVTLRFDHKQWQTQPLHFCLAYRLEDTFEDDDEYWYYNFQTSIRHFTAVLAFEQPVSRCRCFRYQGEVERETYRMRRSVQSGRTHYVLKLTDPPYLEGVMFRWRWRSKP